MPVRQFGGQKSIEAGTILMWAGLLSNIPSGWAICDGMNGTPNLLGDFSKGIPSASTTPGATGGSDSVTLATGQLPSHSHTGTTGSTGSHDHSMPTRGGKGDSDGEGVEQSLGGEGTDEYVGKSGSHNHSLSINNAGSGNSIENRPAYYEIAFIMKL